VIEDDAKDRAWISRTLSEAGWGVQTASTGAEALAQIGARVFDAITLDLLLPDMPGRQVLEGIGRDGLNRETPVIIVTVAPELGVAAGFQVHDILAKPLNAPALLTSLLRARAHPDGGRPILIVDDDPTSLKIAEKMLEDLGYRAVCRGDVEAGLEAAAAEPPCAVVLDLLMPGMNGFEFLRRFRATVDGRRTPVLVWTEKDLSPTERDILRASAQSIVPKGRGTTALIEEVKAYISLPAEASHGR
jgi:CheY-like chemotaxis protein